MTYADSTERAAFIGGLRALADYLEFNPAVPAPIYSHVFVFPPDSNWAAMCAQINAIAARLGAVPYRSGMNHYLATRSFGPVEYRVVAIPVRDNESE
jgi:hypothetical protein